MSLQRASEPAAYKPVAFDAGHGGLAAPIRPLRPITIMDREAPIGSHTVSIGIDAFERVSVALGAAR